ncbi:unnamed protein product [Darwinula stevensoni]|uniref:Kringle domain-containing protein n=1 Tax=Darwinula stevensoni TaxID=69355 RepID=A0A7R8X3A7_9CRUS|nr:unnamed protein product [Darwinula stevensoni]CAG0884309.1 unnamed protein product [Darwinula stevensoni]
MEPFTSLCLALAFLLPAVTGQGGCLVAREIGPCTCEGRDPKMWSHEPDLDCSKARTSEEISSAFGNSWPSTLFWEFRLRDNEDVRELPEGAFGSASFQSIRIRNTKLEAVHPAAILPSKDRLLVLDIQNSRLKEFPFEILPYLHRLLTLNLRGNSLTALPALQSISLRVISLPSNSIASVEEDGWNTPNLRVLDVAMNPSLEVSSGLLKKMERLERFWCPRCKTGPPRSTELQKFNPEIFNAVGLSADKIRRILQDAISGGVASTAYPECRLTEKGREYVGTESKTETGKKCLRWDSKPYGKPKDFSPIEDYEGHFPNRDSWSHENFCRNPSGKERPWCFVSDRKIKWEYCDIPMCDDRDPPKCKVTQQGGEYTGRKNVTLSGLPCQPWAGSAPHAQLELLLHRQAFADAEKINREHNFCRNPDGKVAPWCFNANGDDPSWEFCDIPFCDIQPSDRHQQPSEAAEHHVYPECRLSERGKEYVGTASKTETGRPCLRWDSKPYGMPWDFFHKGYPYEKHFLGASATPHGNHCRNPGLHRRRPWCFVSDPHVKWEYCDIPLCDDKSWSFLRQDFHAIFWSFSVRRLKPLECKDTESGGEYVGTLNVTLSGTPCQRWLTPKPNKHDMWNFLSQFSDELDGPHNFCRNVDEGYGPWCYTVAGVRWEYCDVPFCSVPEGKQCIRVAGKCVDPLECKKTKMGKEYTGTLNTTVSGYPCQPWMSLYPNWHEMGYRSKGHFPDELYPAHNFCRNPDSTDEGPWCYNGSGKEPKRELCDVPMC